MPPRGPATGPPASRPWVRKLLIGAAVAFLALFLVVPLAPVFAHPLAKGSPPAAGGKHILAVQQDRARATGEGGVFSKPSWVGRVADHRQAVTFAMGMGIAARDDDTTE